MLIRVRLAATLVAGLVAAAVVGVLTLAGGPVAAQGCSGGGSVTADIDVEAVPIVVSSTVEDYFVLYASHRVGSATVEYPVQVALGQDGTTTLGENVAALAPDRYRVEKYSIDYPADVDGDCIDDITELNSPAVMNPLNPATNLERSDRFAVIPDHESFERLAYVGHGGKGYVKFVMADVGTDRPSVYFQDTKRMRNHTLLSEQGWRPVRGTVTYDPDLVGPDGSAGVYRLTVEGRPSLQLWNRVYTLVAASMPVLNDDLVLWISNRHLPEIQDDFQSDQTFRARLVFDEDVNGGVDFLALNPGEGYGLLRSLEAGERPHSRDVVVYETLPNELPRVAGIISTVPQTPLSHVNLRALQDGVPNAYIADALDDTDISDLIDSPVYYAVSDTGYSIRAATQTEVDEFYASSRPAAAQTPERDLTVTSITALSEIGFEDWDAFGVKAANVAVLQTLGFGEGTVPDGFAVPFYFYDEFMEHNDLYDDIEEMLADSDFQTDFDTRVDELKKLRKKIKKADTPAWIDTALETMHASFAEGTSLRYRSSTNNEDLPNFNGAGLYDSKTQHPDETTEDGISKSLKQVYASLWNYRAFTERDFHRIDHMATAMGVLVHPNYSDEPVNGVAVSVDPAYGTEGTFYINSQRGEDLVTNPEAHSEPEEILLYPDGTYTVVALSNQVSTAQLLMTEDQMAQLRRHLATIHERFAALYSVEEGEQFAMEVEFKITADNILAIKQARPWIFAGPPPDLGDTGVELTANLEDAPAAHDGSAFAFRILFSENINVGFVEFGAHAVDVTGASVRSAARVNQRSDYWRVTLVPDRPLSDITVVLAHNRHCPVVGAICTSNGLRLSNRLEHTVKAPPPAVPDQPTATALWSGIVDLAWNDVARADSYDVQYSRPPQDSALPALWDDLPGDGIDIAFYGAGAVAKNLPAEPLRFRVRAVGPHGASEWSEHVSVPSTGGPQAWVGVAEPVNSPATGAPTIGGTPRNGETLTADISGIADANGLERVKFNYQWTRSDGTSQNDIPAATGASYSLTAADAGKTITVRVTFVDRHGFSESVSSDPDGLVVNTPAEGVPAIVGTARVAEALAADVSGITDDDGMGDAAFSYQWIRNDGTTDSDIAGATGAGYTPTWDDEAHTIKVRVAFADGAGTNETLTSAATGAVAAAAGETVLEGELTAGRDSATQPMVSGYSSLVQLDGTLTPHEFAYDGDTYQVLYVVHSGRGLWLGTNRGLPVEFTLRVGDAAYHGSRSRTPAPGSAAGRYWWPYRADPFDDGTVAVSLVLHPAIPLPDRPQAPVSGYFRDPPAEHDGSDFSFRVEFSEGVATTADTMRDHVLAVSGGAVSSVEAVGADAKNWAVTVTPAAWAPVTIRIAANLDCDRPQAICASDNRRLHNPLRLVVAAKPNGPPTGYPTITGEVEVGSTLTVNTSAISDPDGMTNPAYTYQWILDDGIRDTDIAGATESTYTPVPADAGNAIRVQVSFSDDAGKPETLTSPPRTERPRALTAQASDGAVVLTWELPQHWRHNTNFFHIVRNRPELGETTPLVRTTRTHNTNTYTDTDTEPDVLYQYSVRGSDFLGQPLDASEPTQIRTPEPPADLTPPNVEPAGLPAIAGVTGHPTRLVASVAGITDRDGLAGAVFEYQWLGVNGATTSVLDGATQDTHVADLTDGYSGYRVRVGYTDDRGTQQTLTSATTAIRPHVVRYAQRLPDLKSTAPYNVEVERVGVGSVRLLPVDGGQTVQVNPEPLLLMRFSSSITNVGDGPVDISGNPQLVDSADATSHDAWQRTLNADDEWIELTKPPIRYETADGHHHFHSMRMAEYSLWDEAGETRLQTAPKVGFCLVDVRENPGVYRLNRVYRDNCRYKKPDTTALTMGISAGMRDVYASHMTFQWVDVSDVVPGRYRLAGQTDPDDLFWESDETNNGVVLTAGAHTVPGYVAVGKQAATGQETAVSVTLDAVAYGEPGALRFRVVKGPSNGTLNVNVKAALGSGVVTYTPDEEFTGSDSFEFEAFDAASEFPRTPVRATATIQVGERVLNGELSAGRITGTTPQASGFSWPVGLGALTPRQFEVDAVTYTIQYLVHTSGSLQLGVHPDLPSNFVLRVGDSTYLSSESLVPRGAGNGYWWPSQRPDWLGDDTAEVDLFILPGTAQPNRNRAPVTGYFRGYPAEHDGTGNVSFRVHFSDSVKTTARKLRDHVLSVSGGTVSRVKAVDRVSRIWAVTVTPEPRQTLTVVIQADLDCGLPAAICTKDGRRLFNHMELTTMPVAWNLPATGAPTVSGTLETGQTLTVDVSDIADANGLTNATFSYQWVSNDGTSDTDIAGATHRTYTLTAADEGKAFKVRVTFTDDAGFPESLTSEPAVMDRPYALTAEITDGAVVLTWQLPAGWPHRPNLHQILRNRPELGETAPLAHDSLAETATNTYTDTDVQPGVLYTYRIQGIDYFGLPAQRASEPVEIRIPGSTPEDSFTTGSQLTAELHNAPASHDGQNTFTFEVTFSEEVDLSYRTVRGYIFDVTGGTVTGARRLSAPSNTRWEVTIQPDSNTAVTIALPIRNCGHHRAVCTHDGQMLANEATRTIPGP